MFVAKTTLDALN